MGPSLTYNNDEKTIYLKSYTDPLITTFMEKCGNQKLWFSQILNILIDLKLNNRQHLITYPPGKNVIHQNYFLSMVWVRHNLAFVRKTWFMILGWGQKYKEIHKILKIKINISEINKWSKISTKRTDLK